MIRNLKIQYRILIGLGSIVLLLAISISLTLFQIRTAKENSDRIVNLRVPTALASSNMAKDIYASLASLRGWMLTGSPGFKIERAKIWEEIAKTKTVMDTLSKGWTNTENIEKWENFTAILGDFSAAQNQVEAIAHTEKARPATKILISKAAPRAEKMLQLITAMINIEISGQGSKDIDSKAVIGVMADVRGSLGESLASIRAYLLTGNIKFRNEFTKQWAKNEARTVDLSRLTSQLSPEQNTAFNEFNVLRTEFSSLSARMFTIRISKQWNMATFLLVKDAMPRANMLLSLLLGGYEEDGTHFTGMVESQRDLLENDNNLQTNRINSLFTMQKGLLFIGVTFGLFISLLIARSISAPVASMTTAMRRLAAGDLDIDIPAQDYTDEIGSMAKAVQVFRQNAIERRRIEKEQIETMRELDFQKYALDAHAIVSITNAKGEITYVNNKFCEISGYPRKELIGESHRIVKSGDHSMEFYEDLWKTITNGKLWHGEIKNLKKGGGHYWLDATIVPFLNKKGKPFQYVAIRTDITERKESETKALKAQKEAEIANRAKSEFLSTMSHELRTPLNAILGFAQVMELNRKEPLMKKQKSYVDHIIRGGNHLLELINQLLDLTKIEAGKVSLSIEGVRLDVLCQECIFLIDKQAKNRGLNITSDIGTTQYIKADYVRFKQVLLNLLSNAVKYNHDGGTIKLACEEISDEMIRVSVTDYGPGIAEDIQGGIFEPFNRLGKDSGEIEGTGIGLTITKQLVEAMDGHIGFESELGKGSTFWVEIPAMDGTVEIMTEQDKSPERIGTDDKISVNTTILYVEDNPANLHLMESIISNMDGVSLVSAHNAELGVSIAEEKLPDLILMDINLPGMDGIAAKKALGLIDKTKDIPVIAISAAAMKSDIERGKTVGFKAYLTKPFNVSEVIKTIETELGA